MIELKGKYNTAKVFADTVEQSAVTQIEHLLDQDFAVGSQIRVMPDVHAGMGCTVGATMTVTDKVVPNLVGVDIGCGMETVLLKDKRLELGQLDKAVHQYIPSGFGIRETPHHFTDEIDLSVLRCAKHTDIDRAALSVGTLGGGNHFIEVDRDGDNRLYLVVHTGSRNLGKQVCDFYQNAAADSLNRRGKGADRVLAYLTGPLLDDYLHDMGIVQRYADLNRKAIVRELEKRVKFKIAERFTTIHNYIDLDRMILRKGAVSAQKGERALIPMNMRDGSLICAGKGNPDWNYSAPHGAGRLMSRAAAKESVTLSEYEKAMAGIYSSTVNRGTIDESPFAYKSADEIIANIGDTADIVSVIRPLYNFKASERE
ncbi:MAG: RtcB family protein [Peptococcaceae bacterium]|jgi:RNA-splicing ligase RtcB|nr:RtcB family protein [Peptococcaceae bacterium]